MEDYGASFFANGAVPGGVLGYPSTIKDPAHVQKSWQSTFGGARNGNKIAVFEEGMKYTLDPWVIRWEQAITKTLLAPCEKPQILCEVQLRGLAAR